MASVAPPERHPMPGAGGGDDSMVFEMELEDHHNHQHQQQQQQQQVSVRSHADADDAVPSVSSSSVQLHESPAKAHAAAVISPAPVSASPSSSSSEHPLGEFPSRTLFVRNIAATMDEAQLRALFERFGAVRNVYTQCRHRGFIMVTYFDIRNALSALRELRGGGSALAISDERTLDVHFSIPKDAGHEQYSAGAVFVSCSDGPASDAELRDALAVHGDVSCVRDAVGRPGKLVEFYDTRCAERALRNAKRELPNGLRLKVESARPMSTARRNVPGAASPSMALSASPDEESMMRLYTASMLRAQQHQQQQEQRALAQQQQQVAFAGATSSVPVAGAGRGPSDSWGLAQSRSPAHPSSVPVTGVFGVSPLFAFSIVDQQQQQQQQQTALPVAATSVGLASSRAGPSMLSAAAAPFLPSGMGAAPGPSAPSHFLPSNSATAWSGFASSLPNHGPAGAMSPMMTAQIATSSSSTAGMSFAQPQQQQQQQQQALAAQQPHVPQLGVYNYVLGSPILGNEDHWSPSTQALAVGSFDGASFANAGVQPLSGGHGTGGAPRSLALVSDPIQLPSQARQARMSVSTAPPAAGALSGSPYSGMGVLPSQSSSALNSSAPQQQQQQQQQQPSMARSMYTATRPQQQQQQQHGSQMGVPPQQVPGAPLHPHHHHHHHHQMQAFAGVYQRERSNSEMIMPSGRSSDEWSLRHAGVHSPSVAMGSPVSVPTSGVHNGSMTSGGNGGGGAGNGALGGRRRQPSDDTSMFVLDLDRVRRGHDQRTTLMVRNIPNKYTQKMLLQAIDVNFRGLYDFFYLPIDFKNKCNVGYAFINFVVHDTIVAFHDAFHNKGWERFNSEKVCELRYARIQGRDQLIAHFEHSSLLSEDKKCRPVLFRADGHQMSHQEPFPAAANRLRRERGRASPASASVLPASNSASPVVGTASPAGTGAAGGLTPASAPSSVTPGAPSSSSPSPSPASPAHLVPQLQQGAQQVHVVFGGAGMAPVNSGGSGGSAGSSSAGALRAGAGAGAGVPGGAMGAIGVPTAGAARTLSYSPASSLSTPMSVPTSGEAPFAAAVMPAYVLAGGRVPYATTPPPSMSSGHGSVTGATSGASSAVRMSPMPGARPSPLPSSSLSAPIVPPPPIASAHFVGGVVSGVVVSAAGSGCVDDVDAERDLDDTVHHVVDDVLSD